MQQLSRPYQFALGALLVFALAWFAFLKPSQAAEVTPLPAQTSAATGLPGAQGLGTAVEKAKAAAEAADAASQTAGGSADPASESPAPGTEPAPGTTGASGATGPGGARTTDAVPADPSAPLLRDTAEGRVAVLLFSSPEGAEDRAVRRALLDADRHGGRVVVRSAPIARVADYAAITEGIDVLQAPTLLVIGKDNRARSLVGYADTRAIDQLVADVGGPAFALKHDRE